jgi:hypothetical protein
MSVGIRTTNICDDAHIMEIEISNILIKPKHGTTPNIVMKVLKAWKISLLCERMLCATENQISMSI